MAASTLSGFSTTFYLNSFVYNGQLDKKEKPLYLLAIILLKLNCLFVIGIIKITISELTHQCHPVAVR
jgi:hypothetical protein